MRILIWNIIIWDTKWKYRKEEHFLDTQKKKVIQKAKTSFAYRENFPPLIRTFPRICDVSQHSSNMLNIYIFWWFQPSTVLKNFKHRLTLYLQLLFLLSMLLNPSIFSPARHFHNWVSSSCSFNYDSEWISFFLAVTFNCLRFFVLSTKWFCSPK